MPCTMYIGEKRETTHEKCRCGVQLPRAPGCKNAFKESAQTIRPSVSPCYCEGIGNGNVSPKKRRRCASVVRANFSCRRPSVRRCHQCRRLSVVFAIPQERQMKEEVMFPVGRISRSTCDVIQKSEGSAVCAARQEGLIQSTGSVFPKLIGMSYRTGIHPSYRLHFHSMQLRCC